MTRWETIIRLTFMALATIVIGYGGGRIAQAHLYGEENRGRHR